MPVGTLRAFLETRGNAQKKGSCVGWQDTISKADSIPCGSKLENLWLKWAPLLSLLFSTENIYYRLEIQLGWHDSCSKIWVALGDKRTSKSSLCHCESVLWYCFLPSLTCDQATQKIEIWGEPKKRLKNNLDGGCLLGEWRLVCMSVLVLGEVRLGIWERGRKVSLERLSHTCSQWEKDALVKPTKGWEWSRTLGKY